MELLKSHRRVCLDGVVERNGSMDTAPMHFCDECGAALTLLVACCPVCQQPVNVLSSSKPVASTSFSQLHVRLLHANERLTQRYILLTQIGNGGFGVVYVAMDRYEKNRLVAIKQIDLATLSPQEVIEATDSYNREVMLLEKLKHSHLPGLYDYFTDAQHWYIVMEYIDGETLDEHLKKARKGRLDLRSVIEIGITLCDVLHYLHTQHPAVIFRDVKPGNIMRSRKGHLYLIDFGIARRYNRQKTKDTGPLGSPGYAAPEQYGTQQTTPQTDIYGLSVTLQTLLTGKEPLDFAGENERASALANAPTKLQRLLAEMQSPDARQRPASMLEVKARLERLQVEIDRNRTRVRQTISGTQRVLTSRYLWFMLLIAVCALNMIASPILIYCLLLAGAIISALSLSEMYAEVRWCRRYLRWPTIRFILWDRAKDSLPYIFGVMLYGCVLNVSNETIWFVLTLLIFCVIAAVCVGLNIYWLVRLVHLLRQKDRRISISPLQQFQYRSH